MRSLDDVLPSVEATAAAELIAGGATYLDVREPVEFDSGHAPGALHIPMDELAGREAELPSGTIVVGCRSGARSARVVERLLAHGHEVLNLTGGLQAWAAAGLEVIDAAGNSGVVL